MKAAEQLFMCDKSLQKYTMSKAGHLIYQKGIGPVPNLNHCYSLCPNTSTKITKDNATPGFLEISKLHIKQELFKPTHSRVLSPDHGITLSGFLSIASSKASMLNSRKMLVVKWHP